MSYRKNENKCKDKVNEKNEILRRKYSSSSDNNVNEKEEHIYSSFYVNNKKIKRSYLSSYNDRKMKKKQKHSSSVDRRMKKKPSFSSDEDYRYTNDNKNDEIKMKKSQRKNLRSSSSSKSNLNKKRTKNVLLDKKEIIHEKYKKDIKKKIKNESNKGDSINLLVHDSKDKSDNVNENYKNEKEEFINIELNKNDRISTSCKEISNSEDTKIATDVLNKRKEEKHKCSQEYITKVESDQTGDDIDDEKKRKINKKDNVYEKKKNMEEKSKNVESKSDKRTERTNVITEKQKHNENKIEKGLEKGNKEGHEMKKKRMCEEIYIDKLIKKNKEKEEKDRETYEGSNKKIDTEKERKRYMEEGEYEICKREKKKSQMNDDEKHKMYRSSNSKYKEKKENDKIIRNESKNTKYDENKIREDEQIKKEKKRNISERDKIAINTNEKKRRSDNSYEGKDTHTFKLNKILKHDDIKNKKGKIDSESNDSKGCTVKKKKYKNLEDDNKQSIKKKSRRENDKKKNYKDKKEYNISYMKMNKENMKYRNENSHNKKRSISSSSYDLSDSYFSKKKTNKKMQIDAKKEKKIYNKNSQGQKSLSYEGRSVHIRSSISSRSISSSNSRSIRSSNSRSIRSSNSRSIRRSNSRSIRSSNSRSIRSSNSRSISSSSSRSISSSSSRSISSMSNKSSYDKSSSVGDSSSSGSISKGRNNKSKNSRRLYRRKSVSSSSTECNSKLNYDTIDSSCSSDRKGKKNKKKKYMNKRNKKNSSSSSNSDSSYGTKSNDSYKVKKKKNNEKKKNEEKEYNPFEEDENDNLEINEDLIEYAKKKIANVTTEDIGKSGGVYIPPFKLERLKNEVTNKRSSLYQKQEWMKLKKKINNIINKVNVDNISEICYELFECNLIRGKGIFSRALIHAQLSSPAFTNVFACLLSVVNSKFPNIGLLTIQRVILHFRRAYKRGDKIVCFNTVKFIAHMINQRILHEIVGLQLCSLLLQNITNDSVQVCAYFLAEVGQLYMNICRRGLDIIFDRLKDIIQEGKINIKTQYDIEKLWNYRKNYFSEFPIVIEELDLIDEDEKIVHEIDLLDENFDNQEELNIFKEVPYEQYEEEDIEWNNISNELLHGVTHNKKGKEKNKENESDEHSPDNSRSSSVDSENDEKDQKEEESSSDSEADNSDADNGDNNESEEENEQNKEEIKDMTEQYLINLRKNVYLSIMSSLSFEECVHKLLKLNIKKGYEIEICNMLIDCCCMEKTFQTFYALQAERLCKLKKIYQENFEKCFENSYNTAHRLETAKLRNCSKFFAHLLYTDAISWSVFMIIKLTEENTTSSTRIFIKILLQELTNNLGLQMLYHKINHPSISPFLSGLFPTNNAQSIRFCINFFTAIGLGALTTSMRKLLLN